MSRDPFMSISDMSIPGAAQPIIVCPLSHVPAVVLARRPSHLITLLDPADLIDTPEGIEMERHLRIGVNDIAELAEGFLAPDAAMVDHILAFGTDWDETTAPLLIHCWAGISRSTATAFMIACARNPHAHEDAIATALRRASVHATPNRRLVALADARLGRGGRMSKAAAAIGDGEFAIESHPFDLASRF